jgi:hypothetical protein
MEASTQPSKLTGQSPLNLAFRHRLRNLSRLSSGCQVGYDKSSVRRAKGEKGEGLYITDTAHHAPFGRPKVRCWSCASSPSLSTLSDAWPPCLLRRELSALYLLRRRLLCARLAAVQLRGLRRSLPRTCTACRGASYILVVRRYVVRASLGLAALYGRVGAWHGWRVRPQASGRYAI